jgi:hypothetical protein
MGLLEKTEKVVVGSVPGGHFFIVPYVVTGVLKGGIKTGVDPQGVTAEVPDIGELLNDPFYVADPVVIGVVKGLGVNFIKHRAFQPVRHNDRSF